MALRPRLSPGVPLSWMWPSLPSGTRVVKFAAKSQLELKNLPRDPETLPLYPKVPRHGRSKVMSR